MTEREIAPGDEPEGALSSVLRPRLAWADISDCPTLDDLGLRSAKEAAFTWQTLRNHAEWNEFTWVPADLEASKWVPEIHGLLGTAAELILTSVEAAAEVEITRRAQQVSASTPQRAAQWRTLRFFAEGQGNNLIVFGHAVANLTIRTLALYRSFTVAGIGNLKPTAFYPKSTNQAAWASLTPKLADEVTAAAADLGPEARALADELGALVRGTWAELWELRGEQYHRWRGESPGVSGINRNRESMAERLRRGEAISFTGQPAAYVEGEQVVDHIVDVADKTLRQVVDWMPRYLENWSASFGAART